MPVQAHRRARLASVQTHGRRLPRGFGVAEGALGTLREELALAGFGGADFGETVCRGLLADGADGGCAACAAATTSASVACGRP